MDHFSPVSALIGGGLIGLAASGLWLSEARIAGISGILGGLLRPQPGESGCLIAFLAGLVLAPLVYRLAGGGVPVITLTASAPVVIAGGLLVGFGTRLGGGCTSGHGVCGVARLSPRSVAATLLFMSSGFATVFIARHLVGA